MAGYSFKKASRGTSADPMAYRHHQHRDDQQEDEQEQEVGEK
jgi:hypothetical protein